MVRFNPSALLPLKRRHLKNSLKCLVCIIKSVLMRVIAEPPIPQLELIQDDPERLDLGSRIIRQRGGEFRRHGGGCCAGRTRRRIPALI